MAAFAIREPSEEEWQGFIEMASDTPLCCIYEGDHLVAVTTAADLPLAYAGRPEADRLVAMLNKADEASR